MITRAERTGPGAEVGWFAALLDQLRTPGVVRRRLLVLRWLWSRLQRSSSWLRRHRSGAQPGSVAVRACPIASPGRCEGARTG